MSDETTLLPCPFCGGEAHISDDYSSKRGMVYSVWHDCPAGGGYHPYWQGVGVLQVTSAWFSSREEAIAAWNTRATHGTLTAEQVRECVQVVYFEGYSDGSVNRGQHLEETDWQAIADELNAELGSGTCELVDCGICKFYHADIQLCEYGIPPCSKFERGVVERVVELGSGTCEPKWTLQGETQTQEFWSCECGNCGECFGVESRESFPFKITIDKVDVPNFCPNCGTRIRKAVS